MGIIHSGDRSIDTAELIDRGARAATGFDALGIRAGDPIALYLRNDLAFLEASLGASRLGAYCLPVNWHYVADEARYVFEDAGVKAVVIHADLLAGVRDAIPAGVPVIVVATPPELRAAYRIDPAHCAPPPGAVVWDAWVASHSPRTAAPVPAPDVMLYTSGTTGRPKGVRRRAPTQDQSRFQEFVRARGFDFRPEDGERIVTVVTGPMYHSAPNAWGTISARYGATVILQPRFDAQALLALIEKHRVTHLQMVPVMLNRLLDLPAEVRARYDLSSLRYVIHSAAPIAPAVKHRMLAWWGPIIHEYYGSTETGMMTLCSPQEWLANPGTVGRPLPEADLRIVGPEGSPLPQGEVGEIACWVQGVPDFTYQNDDDKRNGSFVDHRFLTGDVGYLDENGFLFVCDRTKDMLISGGVNIYPAEIEAELCRMPGVRDCAVFGIPDAEFGESVCAVIERAPGSEIDSAAVTEYLRARLAGYKLPRRIDFQATLPREDSGKIFKRKIRDAYWANAGRAI